MVYEIILGGSCLEKSCEKEYGFRAFKQGILYNFVIDTSFKKISEKSFQKSGNKTCPEVLLAKAHYQNSLNPEISQLRYEYFRIKKGETATLWDSLNISWQQENRKRNIAVKVESSHWRIFEGNYTKGIYHPLNLESYQNALQKKQDSEILKIIDCLSSRETEKSLLLHAILKEKCSRSQQQYFLEFIVKKYLNKKA